MYSLRENIRAFGAIPSNEVKGRIRSAEKNAKMPINRGPWAKKILDLPPLRSNQEDIVWRRRNIKRSEAIEE